MLIKINLYTFLDESNIETEQNLNSKSESSPQSNHSTKQLNDENDEDQEEEEFDPIENDEENNETVLSNQQIGSDSSLDCKICNKQFDNLHRLQRHAMSHDQNPELRKFKCEFCNKAFKFKHHLKVR